MKPLAQETPRSRLLVAIAWILSPEGRKDLGALLAAATAVYTALHRAGLV